MSTINNKITGSLNQIVNYDSANGVITSLNLANTSGVTNLGSNADLTISGGNLGQVLTTDGSGNLSWGNPGGQPAGANTQIQYNNLGVLAGSPNLRFDGTKLITSGANLGNVANVNILGGTNNQVLTTDGTGNLRWANGGGGGGGTPGGSNTQVQYNANGTFAGIDNFTVTVNNDSRLEQTLTGVTGINGNTAITFTGASNGNGTILVGGGAYTNTSGTDSIYNYRSTDYGSTWTAYTPTLPAGPTVYQPFANITYTPGSATDWKAATQTPRANSWFVKSADGGNTWTSMGFVAQQGPTDAPQGQNIAVKVVQGTPSSFLGVQRAQTTNGAIPGTTYSTPLITLFNDTTTTAFYIGDSGFGAGIQLNLRYSWTDAVWTGNYWILTGQPLPLQNDGGTVYPAAPYTSATVRLEDTVSFGTSTAISTGLAGYTTAIIKVGSRLIVATSNGDIGVSTTFDNPTGWTWTSVRTGTGAPINSLSYDSVNNVVIATQNNNSYAASYDGGLTWVTATYGVNSSGVSVQQNIAAGAGVNVATGSVNAGAAGQYLPYAGQFTVAPAAEQLNTSSAYWNFTDAILPNEVLRSVGNGRVYFGPTPATGANGQIQFANTGNIDSSNTFTYAANVLTVNNVTLNGVTGALANVTSIANLATVTSNASLNVAVTGNLVTSTTGNATANIGGALTATVSGNATANITGNLALTTGAITAQANGNVAVTGNANLSVSVARDTFLTTTSGNITMTAGGNATGITLSAGDSGTTGNIQIGANGTAQRVNIGGGNTIVSLGNVANLKIAGAGADNLYLTSNANGQLSWGTLVSTSVPYAQSVVNANANSYSFSSNVFAAYTNNNQFSLFYNGTLVNVEDYTISGNTITYNLPVTAGDVLSVPNRSIEGNLATLIGGSSGQVQYNSGGSFAGSTNLRFDGSTLTVTGSTQIGANITSGVISGSRLAATGGSNAIGIGSNTSNTVNTINFNSAGNQFNGITWQTAGLEKWFLGRDNSGANGNFLINRGGIETVQTIDGSTGVIVQKKGYTEFALSPVTIATSTNTRLGYVAPNSNTTGLTIDTTNGTITNNTGRQINLQISLQMGWEQNGTGARSMWINFADTPNVLRYAAVQVPGSSAVELVTNSSTVLSMTNGSVISIWAFQSSGGPLDINGTIAGMTFSGRVCIVVL